MNPPRTDIRLERSASNLRSNDYTNIPASQDSALQRDAGLLIRQFDNQKHFHIFPSGPLFPAGKFDGAQVELTQNELFSHVANCRDTWSKKVVDHLEVVKDPRGGQRNYLAFQEKWDFKDRSDLKASLGRKLASAGAQLFFHIFGNGAEARKKIGQVLADESHQRDLIITITSDVFFAPWGLLYTHPVKDEKLEDDGSNFKWEGFWGYSHIIEHNTAIVDLETTVKPNSSGRISLGVNIDETIDKQFKVDCVAAQRTFFKSVSLLDTIERRVKPELRAALSSKFLDQIVYFYCHGTGAGTADAPNIGDARIALTDKEPITGAEIQYWLRERELESHPIVFLNACQGGQMTTMFYMTLAAELLKRKARGLVGAQIDIPAVFAAQYAREFFTRLLDGSRKRVLIGPLMRELTRHFIDNHNNPLGLVYSLYRGADCFVEIPSR